LFCVKLLYLLVFRCLIKWTHNVICYCDFKTDWGMTETWIYYYITNELHFSVIIKKKNSFLFGIQPIFDFLRILAIQLKEGKATHTHLLYVYMILFAIHENHSPALYTSTWNNLPSPSTGIYPTGHEKVRAWSNLMFLTANTRH